MASADWHRSTELYKAAEQFHDNYAREPEMKRERQIHEQYTGEIRKSLQAEKTCHRLEYTGSSYEGVKVAKSPTDPDLEFDVMVILTGGNELEATPIPGWPGFATLRRIPKSCVVESMNNNKDGEGNILTRQTIYEFFGKLQKIINASADMRATVKLIDHGPAVQMDVYEGTKESGPKLYSVDMVPTYEVNGAMYVAKRVSGANPELENAWRQSFSLEEKKCFDAIDGTDNGCRKKVLRVLKVLRNREAGLAQLTSYHLKTALFKVVEQQPNWQYDQLGVRLMDVLGRLEEDLTSGYMQHKFIPEINLLSGMTAKSIENMRDRINRWRSNQKQFTEILNSQTLARASGPLHQTLAGLVLCDSRGGAHLTMGFYQLQVTDLSGRTKILTLPNPCTVDQLYEAVISRRCAPGKGVADLRLVYEGMELVRGQMKCLHDYDMPPMGASIFMVVRQVGGVDLKLPPMRASLLINCTVVAM